MAKKIKIPQNVADAIETLRNAEYSDYGIVKYVDDGGPIHIKSGSELQEVLRDWTYENDGENSDLLLDALRIGYEIEPVYKLGEWVVYGGKVFEIKHIPWIGHFHLGRIGGGTISNVPISEIRHATYEEVQEEKERQIWTKIGRDVGEIKEGDIGIARNGAIVTAAEKIEEYHKQGDLVGFYPTESFISFEDGDSNA